jgi:hypothetical protein
MWLEAISWRGIQKGLGLSWAIFDGSIPDERGTFLIPP